MLVEKAVRDALKLHHQEFLTRIVGNLDKLLEGLAVLDHGIMPYFRELFLYFSLN